jgi:hypothetical protein
MLIVRNLEFLISIAKRRLKGIKGAGEQGSKAIECYVSRKRREKRREEEAAKEGLPFGPWMIPANEWRR